MTKSEGLRVTQKGVFQQPASIITNMMISDVDIKIKPAKVMA
ncbi:MAG: hypothetical protein WA240_16360 [Nitrospirota bacterium]